MSMFFIGMEQGETLEKFLDRVVRPDTEFISNCGEVIDTVVRLIHKLRHPKYSVNQVIKGGSLGKGTAVRNHSDVDLLVVLNGFRNLEDLVENMEDVIESFKDHLLSVGDISIQMYPGTPFTLQFGVFCPSKGIWIDVDLLPIVNIFSTDSSLEDIYTTMHINPDLRKYYAKCLAKLQVDFVKRVPCRVKDLIRLLKYWNYTENQYDRLKEIVYYVMPKQSSMMIFISCTHTVVPVTIMSSYSLELLVIYVWRQHGKPDNFTMKNMIKDVADLLAAFSTVRVSFDDHYNAAKYIRILEREPPFILDPANPFHDVAKEEWSEQLNLNQFQVVYLQSGREYQGRRQQWLQSSALGSVFSENTSTINSIERKGAILKRKYNSLPEESQGRSTLEKVVIVGSVLAMAFVLLKDDKKN